MSLAETWLWPTTLNMLEPPRSNNTEIEIDCMRLIISGANWFQPRRKRIFPVVSRLVFNHHRSVEVSFPILSHVHVV